MEKKWNEFLGQMKSHKKFPNRQQLLLLLLCGLLLLVIVWPSSEEEGGIFPDFQGGKSAGEENVQPDSDNNQAAAGCRTSMEMYEEYLEGRLAEALEYVEGVGKAEVVITIKSSGQKIVEKDQNSGSQISSETDQNGGTREVEDRSSDHTSIYTQSSDGTQIPYVSKEMTPEIEGVLVIAQGGDNAVVVQNITEAIQALFGVEAHKIKIMKRTDT